MVREKIVEIKLESENVIDLNGDYLRIKIRKSKQKIGHIYNFN